MYTTGLVVLLLALAFSLNGRQKWVSRLYVEQRRHGRSTNSRLDYTLGLCDKQGNYTKKGITP